MLKAIRLKIRPRWKAVSVVSKSELKLRIDDFRTQNSDKTAGYADTQNLINDLLLPIVFQKPGTNDADGSFLFEANSREDGTSFEVNIPYADIPTDLRERIKSDLQSTTGRKPTPEEVSAQYAKFRLGR